MELPQLPLTGVATLKVAEVSSVLEFTSTMARLSMGAMKSHKSDTDSGGDGSPVDFLSFVVRPSFPTSTTPLFVDAELQMARIFVS